MPLLFNTALKILNSTFTSWKKERHPTLRGKRSFHFFMILYVDKSHTHIQKDKRKDSAKSCQTRDLVDCSLPGSSVHGILQARILQWVTISFSRGSSQTTFLSWVSCVGRRILYHLSHQGSPHMYVCVCVCVSVCVCVCICSRFLAWSL